MVNGRWAKPPCSAPQSHSPSASALKNHSPWREQTGKTSRIAIRAASVLSWNTWLIYPIKLDSYRRDFSNHKALCVNFSGDWIPLFNELHTFANWPKNQNYHISHGTKTESGPNTDSGVLRSCLNLKPKRLLQLSTRKKRYSRIIKL
jgi:hypothetical protein